MIRSPRAIRAASILAAAALPIVTTVAPAGAESLWDGGGDGTSWSDAANWDPDGVPDATTDVRLDGGVTVTLDIDGVTQNLELVDATIGGSGDLDVSGHLAWGLGTIGGTGRATLTGGLTFLDGPAKVIARDVDAFCDVVWEHSDIFFDTVAGAVFHQHAGFLFTITDEASRGRGETAEREASHLDAPLAGDDPRADDTELYAFVLDGEVLANTTVTHRISFAIGGSYTQGAGTTSTFDAGSRIATDASYTLGDGAELVHRRGTHIMEGGITGSGASPATVTVRPEATVSTNLYTEHLNVIFDILGWLDSPVPFSAPELTLRDGSAITGSGGYDVERVVTNPSNPQAAITIGSDVHAGLWDWEAGNVFIDGDRVITIKVLEIEHTATGLGFGETDPESLSRVRVEEAIDVKQTTSVYPRFETIFEAGFESGDPVQWRLESNTGVTVRDVLTVRATIDLAHDAVIDIDLGETTIETTSRINGPGEVTVSPNGTLVTNDTTNLDANMTIEGTLRANGTNRANAALRVHGGTIEGPGTIRARVELTPASPAQQAAVDGATLEMADGSVWQNGSILLLNGAAIVLLGDAAMVIDHAATNLTINHDGDPGDLELFQIDGTLYLANTASVPPGFNVPVTVGAGGTLEIAPGAGANFPGLLQIDGVFRVREDGSARFIFNTHQLGPDGRLEGGGTITIQLNGHLDLLGTVSPGEEGVPGTLTFVGPFEQKPGSVLEIRVAAGGEHSRVDVNGAATVDGTAMLVTETPLSGDQDFDVMSASSLTGTYDDATVVGSNGTMIDVVETPLGVVIETVTAADLASISGRVVWDRKADGVDDTDIGVPGFTVERLQDGGLAEETESLQHGRYYFTGLLSDPVVQTVRLVLPPDWSAVEPAGGQYAFLLADGQHIDDADFAMVRTPQATIEVSSNADSGPGSLRTAIADAALAGGYTVIRVRSDLERLVVASPLPPLSSDVLILSDDASARGGAGTPARFTIDGSSCTDCDGLTITSGRVYISDVAIERFDGHGIVVEGDTALVTVTSTKISDNALGGVLLAGGDGNVIARGVDATTANEITSNGGPGIAVVAGKGHRLLGNVIHGNAGLAIDIGDDGVTANDAGDVDLGPNGFQNAPALTGVAFDGTSVDGTLESRALTTYRIEIFGGDACHMSGTGEAAVLLGTATVMTDVSGAASFTIPTLAYVGQLSATATAPDGSTSELSACFTADVVSTDAGVTPAITLPVAYPNPAVDRWVLAFVLPGADRVEADLFDVSGRLVRRLHRGVLPEGTHRLTWDGRSERDRAVGAGVYFYSLRIGETTHRGRVVRVDRRR